MTQVQDDLAYVRRIVENSRAALSVDSLPLLVWGALTLVGVGLVYTVEALDGPWLWAVLIAIAWLYTGWRMARTRGQARLFAQRVLATTWFAVLTSMTLIGFVGTFSGALPTQTIPPVFAAFFGLAYLASAVLTGRQVLVGLAIAWWVGAALLFFVPPSLRLVVFGGLLLVLLIVPALVLHRSAATQ